LNVSPEHVEALHTVALVRFVQALVELLELQNLHAESPLAPCAVPFA
jgi:hypothetical protein